MDHFIDNCLNNIGSVFSNMPYDSLLYGKPETVISSSMASLGNIGIEKEIPDEYYRTEVDDIDIVRIDKSSGYAKLACESKFGCVSDYDRKKSLNYKNIYSVIGYGPISMKLDRHIGKSHSYIDIILCQSIQQVIKYTNRKHKGALRLVLLNLLFFPNDTNGYLETNSGLKYIDKKRLEHDRSLWLKASSIENICEEIDKMIMLLPVKTTLYPDVICIHKRIYQNKSLLGFNYYIVTLAYLVPSTY